VTTMLSTGEVVNLQASRMASTVEVLLGSGGQGEVYQVLVQAPGLSERYALKWYYPHTANNDQFTALRELVDRGSPHPRFLWPVDLATTPSRREFGYLMPLRGERFASLADLMTQKVSPTFRALTTVGFELTDGFLELHSAGLCYRDINFGNVFFDPATGHVLICDNDNVGINGRPTNTVSGTFGFMAPEIMRQEAMPSTATDLYSLSVLLFYLFMVHHPLLGRRELDEPSLDEDALKRLFGIDPLFIFDPHDRSNEPVAGFHDNALQLWPLYPRFLRNYFTRAFTAGLRDPAGGRVGELEWLHGMVRLRDAIVYCGGCGVENFWDDATATVPPCWNCGATVTPPPRLVLDRNVIMLNHDAKVFPHHVRLRKFSFDEPIAEVSRHPTQPDVWGLKNLSTTKWIVTPQGSPVVEVAPGRSVLLAPNCRIHFGIVEGIVKF
jgi:eukaryotic-like serine/threonine-protein kinase